MNYNKLNKDISTLEGDCDGFLTISKLEAEERERLNAPAPTPIQIKAFDAIVNECKDEISHASLEKMASSLSLLYNLNIQPFDAEVISQKIEEFVSKQLNSEKIETNEKKIKMMQNIVENIDQIREALAKELKKIHKESQKWYVFNSSKRKNYSDLYRRATVLKKNIELQMEYESKDIAQVIIDDFYNIYIFFSYLIHLCIKHNQQLLSIEIADFLDRYIKIINHIFNNRHLKAQDMLYYYVIYELDELRNLIYNQITEKKTVSI